MHLSLFNHVLRCKFCHLSFHTFLLTYHRSFLYLQVILNKSSSFNHILRYHFSTYSHSPLIATHYLVHCLNSFSLPDDVKCDVLYDLYETGFYFDLVSFENSANCSNMDPHLRMELVWSCFPPHFGPQIPAELRFANCGLSAPLIQHRLPYLLAIRTLVMGWHASPHRPLPLELQISKPSEQYTESEAVRLEKAITEYITQAFWDYFGCAMIVPHYRWFLAILHLFTFFYMSSYCITFSGCLISFFYSTFLIIITPVKKIQVWQKIQELGSLRNSEHVGTGK